MLKQLALLCLLLLATPAHAADFTWLDEQGHSQRIAQLHGKPVVVHLWASWCPPCREELKAFDQWRQQHPEIAVLMVSLDRHRQDAVDFYRQKEITEPVLLTDEAQARSLGAQSLPTTIIVASDGSVATIHRGPREWSSAAFSAQMLASIEQASEINAKTEKPDSDTWLCRNTGMLCP